MKILLVANMYPSKKYPHYGVFVENTYEQLRKRGYCVDKVVLHKKDIRILRQMAYVLFYVRIVVKCLFGKYDFVYGHFISHIAIPLLFSNFFKNNKLILNAHGNDLVPEDEKDEKLAKYVKKILEKSDRAVVPSCYFKDILVQEYQYKAEKIYIYPSGGVDSSVFYSMEQAEARQELNLQNDMTYIGYASRIEKDKGWDTFLKMISENNWENVKFIIVGNGSEEEKMNQMLKKLKIENRILRFPFMKQTELNLLYNALDVFVFPTYRKSESLGLVGLEAMACGCVVVASKYAGPATYIEQGVNGFFFQKENAEDLKCVVNQVLDADELVLKQISMNARERAKEYDQDKIQDILYNIFETA